MTKGVIYVRKILLIPAMLLSACLSMSAMALDDFTGFGVTNPMITFGEVSSGPVYSQFAVDEMTGKVFLPVAATARQWPDGDAYEQSQRTDPLFGPADQPSHLKTLNTDRFWAPHEVGWRL